jgi:MFS transporter, DHA1 family, multidrug resistance protein
MAILAADIITGPDGPNATRRELIGNNQVRPPRAQLPLTILIAGLNNAPLAAGRLIMPMIALSMGISTPVIGVMAALFSLAPMLFNVSFGRWVDRVGTLVPMLFSTGLILLACLLFDIFGSQEFLLAMAGLIGAGAMFSHVVATRAVGDIGNSDVRARNLGYLVVGYSFFQFLGPMAAGVAYEKYGAAIAVASMGGFSLLAAMCLACRTHNFSSSPKERRTIASPGRTVELLAIPSLLRWLVTNGIFGGIQTIYPLVVSLHSVEIGLSPAEAGSLLGAFAIGSAVSRATVRFSTRRLKNQTVVLLALLCGAFAYALLPALHTIQPLLGLSLVLGFAIGLGAPISLTLIYETAPPNRINESIGLGMTMTNFLQTFLPLILGFVAAGLGVGSMVWLLAAAILIAAAMILKSRNQ